MYVILSKRIPFETFQVQLLRERVLAQRAARAQRLQEQQQQQQQQQSNK